MFSLVGCVPDEQDAIRATEDLGMTDVVVEDSSFFAAWEGCAQDDGIAYKVSALNPSKKKVSLTVCCGTAFKSCTVRSSR